MSVGTPGALPQPPLVASYLGQGLSYPLAYSPNTGRLLLSNGTQSVTDSLSSILSTEPGERVMQPDYGASVGTFEPVDPGRQKIALEQSIADHEPRVKSIDQLDVTTGPTADQQQATIRYQIIGQATPNELVYPYFVGPQ